MANLKLKLDDFFEFELNDVPATCEEEVFDNIREDQIYLLGKMLVENATISQARYDEPDSGVNDNKEDL